MEGWVRCGPAGTVVGEIVPRTEGRIEIRSLYLIFGMVYICGLQFSLDPDDDAIRLLDTGPLRDAAVNEYLVRPRDEVLRKKAIVLVGSFVRLSERHCRRGRDVVRVRGIRPRRESFSRWCRLWRDGFGTLVGGWRGGRACGRR